MKREAIFAVPLHRSSGVMPADGLAAHDAPGECG
jgi:hypothetical protein